VKILIENENNGTQALPKTPNTTNLQPS